MVDGRKRSACSEPHQPLHLILTLLLPRALLEMLESLLATISTSLAKIPIQVELSSPERHLEGGVCTSLTLIHPSLNA